MPDEGRPPLREVVSTHPLRFGLEPEAGSDDIFPVYEDKHVTVTGVLAEHPPVFSALALRIET